MSDERSIDLLAEMHAAMDACAKRLGRLLRRASEEGDDDTDGVDAAEWRRSRKGKGDGAP